MDPKDNQHPDLTQDPQSIKPSAPPVSPPPVIEPPTFVPTPQTANELPISPPSVQVQAPPPLDVPPMQPSEGGSSKPSKLLLVLLIVFAVVLAGLVYTLLNGSFLKSAPVPVEKPVSPIPTGAEVSTPEATPTLSAEDELNQVDVGSIEAELEEVKTDLDGL